MPELVKKIIRDIPDFPKEGIVFKDITTVLKDSEGLKHTIDFLTEQFKDKKIDYVAGVESRGFIFGTPLAYNLGAGFVVIRKPGKLPADVESITYDLEYGSDTLEIHKDAIEKGKRVLIVDDLLATGGTAAAACELVKKVGGEVAGMGFIIELEALGGRSKFPSDVEVISMVTC
ncbi:MAG: adenine phosphoribosyltransferase [Candidatus Gastranaerophilales bacterium]|nr:adenine phosphoribosyltransferase [Candidatus Gastranaerophilales bacterium]